MYALKANIVYETLIVANNTQTRQQVDSDSSSSPEDNSTYYNADRLPADYENTNVDQMVATDYENSNVEQIEAINYESLPPQNSGTYESIRLPHSFHIYDALNKDGI